MAEGINDSTGTNLSTPGDAEGQEAWHAASPQCPAKSTTERLNSDNLLNGLAHLLGKRI